MIKGQVTLHSNFLKFLFLRKLLHVFLVVGECGEALANNTVVAERLYRAKVKTHVSRTCYENIRSPKKSWGNYVIIEHAQTVCTRLFSRKKRA